MPGTRPAENFWGNNSVSNGAKWINMKPPNPSGAKRWKKTTKCDQNT